MTGFMLGRKDTWVHANPDPICDCGNMATKYCKTEMKLLSAATWLYFCPPHAAQHERDTGDECRDIPPNMTPR